jgi:hypothetical protein
MQINQNHGPQMSPKAMARPPGGRLKLAWALGTMLLTAAACGTSEASEGARASAEVAPTATVEAPSRARSPTHVDSILPIEEALRRFRQALGPEPTALGGGARSRDDLVNRFARALAAYDTTAFAGMLMSVEEFAWLYYPHTRYTEAPYRQAPELVWFQIQNGTSRGLGRLLTRLGGTALDVRGYHCSPEPIVEGPNRIWDSCVLRVASLDGEVSDRRLFGSIVERDGAFKFVSYANDF